RRVADERSSEIELALYGNAVGLERLRHQLSQDALLGEVLRPDDDAIATAAGGERRDHPEQRGEPPHRGGRPPRSPAPGVPSPARATAAAGSAPARIVRLSTIATPRKMKTPRPPAPIAAAMVASPIPITVASRTPARMTLAANGSSTRRRSWPSVMPSPRPASRTA